MSARALAVGSAFVALVAPTMATAKVVPTKHPAAPGAKVVVKHPATPRVLCICITFPVTPVVPASEEQWEAEYDQDLIAHGLDPVYGTTTSAFAATA